MGATSRDGAPAEAAELLRVMSFNIRYGTANVTLPKGTEADDVTFEQALELIAEKVPAKGKKKAAAKKTATKTAAKKPAAKKTATTKKAPAKKPAAKKKPAASKTASAKAKTE